MGDVKFINQDLEEKEEVSEMIREKKEELLNGLKKYIDSCKSPETEDEILSILTMSAGGDSYIIELIAALIIRINSLEEAIEIILEKTEN
jgi:hypothetical protein